MFESWILGSRKFIIMLLVLIIGVTFRIYKLINGAQMVSLFNTVGVSFMASNAVEYMYASVKTWVNGSEESSDVK